MSTANDAAKTSGKLWGGRFASEANTALENLSRSPEEFFRRMVPFDVIGSKAHAGELVRAGVLTADERATIEATLDDIVEDHTSGTIEPAPTDEDVHGYLERHLTDRLGALGGKLRAGRSRNDQTANELRIYLRSESRIIGELLTELIEALSQRAAESAEVAAPGFTHLQPAQPIIFGHQLLAHAFALLRDLKRFEAAYESSAFSPLGAAALAGSPMNRDTLAAALEQGFDGIRENSIDGVSSRDHVVDFLFAGAMLGADLSRLSEELILWSTVQFGWIGLDDAFSTGSSIMPQKKNPDIPELTRGKSARLISNLNGMLTALKGIPFAYNRDLAEDKHFAFDSADTIKLVLPAMSGLIRTMKIREQRMGEQATQGFTLATELADWLAEQGIPFSEAHHVTGRVVQLCEEHGIELDELTLETAQQVDPRITAEALARFDVFSALRRRTSPGGTAPSNIEPQRRQIAEAIEQLRSRFVD